MRRYLDRGALPDLYILDDKRLVFIPIAKNATTSLDVLMRDVRHRRMNRAGAINTGYTRAYEVAVLWRDPWARMYSAWMYACKTGSTLTLDEYVLYALETEGFDNTICPQFQYCFYDGDWLPTTIIKWNFKELAYKLGVDEIPVKNSTHGERPTVSEEISGATYERFRKVYAVDFALWSAGAW